MHRFRRTTSLMALAGLASLLGTACLGYAPGTVGTPASPTEDTGSRLPTLLQQLQSGSAAIEVFDSTPQAQVLAAQDTGGKTNGSTTPTATPSRTATATGNTTPVGGQGALPTATSTRTPTPAPGSTATPTAAASPSATATATATPSPTPTSTPTPAPTIPTEPTPAGPTPPSEG
ncbi:MAG: hypothetical protein HY875_07475 [Chloroflexi bacterium]|nr:hypothetical protein [Chloroflexota bacterium]